MLFMKMTYWLYLAFAICLSFFHQTTQKTNFLPFLIVKKHLLIFFLLDFYPSLATFIYFIFNLRYLLFFF